MSPGFIGLRITSRDMALCWRARHPCSTLSTLQTTSALVRNARFVECCRRGKGRRERGRREGGTRGNGKRVRGRTARTVCMKIKFITIKSFTSGTRVRAYAGDTRTRECAPARSASADDEIWFNAISRTRGIERRYLCACVRAPHTVSRRVPSE